MKGKHGKFPSGRVRRIDPRNLKEEEERPRMSNAKGKKKKKNEQRNHDEAEWKGREQGRVIILGPCKEGDKAHYKLTQI